MIIDKTHQKAHLASPNISRQRRACQVNVREHQQ